VPLAPGTQLGPYEIVAPLGQGGMGEVYRARDTRLGRDVAVKVLPQHLSAQPEIRARFEREAKTVSSLNHPNICVLFDVGRAPGEAGSDDIDFLVMELVEGETLAERLKRGPLSNADLLRFGTQMADALDRAHRAGVIHRDLKPGNIMITRSGAKLMDFGLARVTGLAPGGGSGATQAMLSQSPTVAQALTAEGSLLGTFQYMSPEQLEGREADARSDIWALGCVLYEMVTGRRAFEGRSQASLIAAILEREPAGVGEEPSGSAITAVGGPPHGIDRLIRNCLAKDPDERVQTAHDVKLQLQGIAEGAGLAPTSTVSTVGATAPVLARPRGGSMLAWGIAVAGLLAAVGIFAWLYPRTQSRAASVRFSVAQPPGTTSFFWPRVSPDGRYLIGVAIDSANVQQAWLRPMDQLDFHPIPGTEGVSRVYWSPDSREVAFVSNDKMQRVSITGGSPVIVCAAQGGADVSWGSKGQILMDGQTGDSLRVVPAGGGELQPATRIDYEGGETGSAWPFFLPDGQHFLFVGSRGNLGTGNIRLGKLGSLESKLLGTTDGRVEYAPGGWVLFLRGTTLLAQKLDVGAGRLTGQPITIRDDMRVGGSAGHFSISGTGTLALSPAVGGARRSIHVADRTGAAGPPLVSGPVATPRVSPDGRRLLYTRVPSVGNEGGEIFVFDLERKTDTRLTFTGDSALTPVWSPDGQRFACMVRGASRSVIRIASADGLGGQDSIAVPDAAPTYLTQWTGDGSIVMFNLKGQCFAVSTGQGGGHRRALGDSTKFLILDQISPDGRWLAGGRGRRTTDFNVYVQSLQGPPGQWQIGSGFLPQWTRGGRELVYETATGDLMAVDIDTSNGFHPGIPRVLFHLPMSSWTPSLYSWGVDAAGEKFYLVDPPPNEHDLERIEVVTNFENLVTRR
jgi:eukaryotic-like serine/threonine-protein kinase